MSDEKKSSSAGALDIRAAASTSRPPTSEKRSKGKGIQTLKPQQQPQPADDDGKKTTALVPLPSPLSREYLQHVPKENRDALLNMAWVAPTPVRDRSKGLLEIHQIQTTHALFYTNVILRPLKALGRPESETMLLVRDVLAKSDVVISGLSTTLADVVQLSISKLVMEAKKPDLTFTLAVCQPNIASAVTNLALYEKAIQNMKSPDFTPRPITRYDTTTVDFSGAVMGLVMERKLNPLTTCLWLNTTDWRFPTSAFYPKHPSSYVDILLGGSPAQYTVIINKHSFWNDLAAEDRESIQKLYTVYFPEVGTPSLVNVTLVDHRPLCCFVFVRRPL